ncbi:hypothetical protein [Halodesulfovibrio aestuarii]|uniref:hypothetical protein n=1 Tax=Halodesulfovibrio aestuarii TaxID=126333 RepID=UPI0004848C83
MKRRTAHVTTEDPMEILKKLWRGELPLYITFWFFGMVIGTVVSFFVNKYALQVQKLSDASRVSCLMAALFYTGFLCVALWRSAENYQGAPLWSIGARFYSAILLMSFVSFAVEIVKITYNT